MMGYTSSRRKAKSKSGKHSFRGRRRSLQKMSHKSHNRRRRMESPNGTPASAEQRESKTRNFPLNTKQQQFFLKQRKIMAEIDSAMKGALGLIVEENDIKATKLTLSED